jgi:hypothetical protein
MFRDNLSVTSVTNYQSEMRNIQEERRSHINLGGSVKSRSFTYFQILGFVVLRRPTPLVFILISSILKYIVTKLITILIS